MPFGDPNEKRDAKQAAAYLFGWTCWVVAVLVFCFTLINAGRI